MSRALAPAQVTLIVIAKAPLPGLAKTRLTPAVGPDGAAALARAALEDTLAAVALAARAGGHEMLLALEGEPGPWLQAAGGLPRIVPQRGEGLGERLGAAFEDADGPAVLVGMDTPQIEPATLRRACARLCEPGTDAVIGLAEDGGWWTLGLREPDASLFDGVEMSADDTGEQQLAALRRAGLRHAELEVLVDVDEIEDAKRVAGAAPRSRFAATLAGLIAMLALLVGCGSSGSEPAAEPADSPATKSDPAGTVIDLPGEAEGVAADPKTGIVAVGIRDPNEVVLVPHPEDGAKAKLRRVKVPASGRHMALAKPGGPILTTAEYKDYLLQISLPAGRVTKTKVDDFPHAVAEAPNGRIFVGDEGGDSLTVVAGHKVVKTLPTPEQPGGVATSGDVVGVVTVAARELTTYDARTLERLDSVGAGVGPTHVVAGAGGRLYVTDTQGDAVLVYETRPELRFVDRINVPGTPYGIAIDNRARELWVTETETNRVVGIALDGNSGSPLASFPTVRQPNTVAVDPASGRVYVAGRAHGELEVIDAGAEGNG